MKKQFAKRPNFSDIESDHTIFKKVCKTCWQSVDQPCIKGIWVHSHEYEQRHTNCKKLIPVSWDKLNRDKQYTCSHEFRFTKDISGCLKCTLCGFPQRIDTLDQINYRYKYFCFTCNKPFKIVSLHFMRIHKSKGFEYKRVID